MERNANACVGHSTRNIKMRLIGMNFLEFAVWGAYLTSLGNYLGNAGLAGQIGWFYAIQGIVSLFMPAVIGIVADRLIPAQKTLSLCQLLAGVFMLAAGSYCHFAEVVEFAPLFVLYTLSVAFFMPTIGLANSVAYTTLGRYKLDTVRHFPPIRIFGTIGFICAMLFVNFVKIDGVQMQSSYMQLIFSGLLSIVLALYALTIPECPIVSGSGKSKSLYEALGLRAFSLFKERRMAIFFIFSMLLGVSLQITNGFANPFISCFSDAPGFEDAWGARNANALISLSQISETLCILLIPFFLKRFGIKGVMLISMFAWVLRFGFFGVGNPGDGVVFFILSMVVYGVAFDFFNVSGSLYVDSETDASIRSSAQGLFMIMTNGIGATIGTLSAQAVVSHFVDSNADVATQISGWHTCWYIFAAYALVVGVLFMIVFRNPKGARTTDAGQEAAEDMTLQDPEGMANA